MTKSSNSFTQLKYKGKFIKATTSSSGTIFIYEPQGLKKILLKTYYWLIKKEYPYGFKQLKWFGVSPDALATKAKAQIKT